MSVSVWSQCRVQELSQIPSKDAHGVHMLGDRMNARPPSPPSLPACQGEGGSDDLAGPFLRGQARCEAPHRAVNTYSPTRTTLRPGPLVVNLVLFQQSDPEGRLPGAQCHRSHPPPILGTVSWARLGMAFTPEFHVCRRQMTQFKAALCLDF